MGDVVSFPPRHTRDYEAAAQRAAEEHLAACQEAMFDEFPSGAEGLPESPSIGPFCGCDTCVVREVLHAAWPHVLELAREEARLAR